MAFAYQGIKKIKIPVKPDEIRTSQGAIAVFNKYLNDCIKTHQDNARKMQKYADVYEGKQDILLKTRPYSSNVNSKVVENHAKRQVDFKTNFMLRHKLIYTRK